MKKQVLMIHEVDKNIFNLPLEKYILTFDDGLYSQYHFLNEFDKIKTKKIFFISTNIICEKSQSKEIISCELAHKKAFTENKENYMTKEQILELKNKVDCEIGGHSHFHKNLSNFSSLSEKIKHIKEDTELMLNWFRKELNFTPTKFCFPYNDDLNGLYKITLKKYGFKEFFGRERISI
jgi:peptidoglycan/xylan/chitin deacetylase (PgdA/CDA1 family)